MNGRGNYWSDNPAFDLNGDGMADSPYRPNDLDRQGTVDRAAGQGADQQPRRANHPLGAEPVPGHLCREASSTAALYGAAAAGLTTGLTMTATIAVQGLTKRYGNIEAVRDVGFDLEPGEIVALVGHNGAGKTTLLKLLLGLVHPTEGSMRVLGEDPAAGQFEARRRLGYLPENVSFNPALTARELISFYARLKGQAGFRSARVARPRGPRFCIVPSPWYLLEGHAPAAGPGSGVDRQTGVLLLDEPTTGLDPALRLDFYDIVEARRAAGATVVLSSHALAELGDRAGRIIIMNRGKMVANGTIDHLRHLARLPAKIRCKAADGNAEILSNKLAAAAVCRRVNGHTFEIDAMPERKLELLHLVTDLPVMDVDVVPPSLDELYAHFLRAEAAR